MVPFTVMGLLESYSAANEWCARTGNAAASTKAPAAANAAPNRFFITPPGKDARNSDSIAPVYRTQSVGQVPDLPGAYTRLPHWAGREPAPLLPVDRLSGHGFHPHQRSIVFRGQQV